METSIYMSYSGHTFIKANLNIQEHLYEGFFLIDTASSNNILNMHFFQDVQFTGITENERKVFTSSGTCDEIERHLEGSIKIGDVIYTEMFNMMNMPAPMFIDDSMTILGILGIEFLVNNHIVIDYEKKNLRSATEEDMHFASHYPTVAQFMYGLNHYGVPTLGISNSKDDNVMLTILDTGSNINIICESARKRFGFNFQEIQQDGSSSFHGVQDSRESSKCKLNFSMMCLKDGKMCYPPMSDEFDVDPNSAAFINEEGEYPVEGIIGNDFLFSNKCIINCATGYVYCHHWHEIPLK